MKTNRKSGRTTGPAQTKTPDAQAASQGPGGNQAPSLQSVAEAEPAELFAFKECQDLLRTRLAGPLLKLFAQLTGQRLHVLWHCPLDFLGPSAMPLRRVAADVRRRTPPLDFQGPGALPVLCPRARQRAGPKSRPPKRCQSCLRRRWGLPSSPASQGRRFIGQCGATNFCACPQVDKLCPLTLILQARVAPRSPSSHSVSQGTYTRFRAEHPAEPISPAAFRHAVALVRLLLHDLASTAQARLARSALDNALRRLHHTQIEAARLRAELRHRLPGLPESTVPPALGSHAQKLVAAMLDCVHHHGLHPVSLADLAAAMKMNASYLSALFSQTTGVTFHQFREEVRLAKAKELLRDPRNRVSEVADAAGYASPNSFRHAFKAHEGLSPEAWRAGP